MQRLLTLTFLIFLALMVPAALPAQVSFEDDPHQLPSEVLERPLTPRSVDLAEIKESRIIRVLVSFNRTNFFVQAGRIRGFEYELLTAYEKHLNKGRPRREIRTTMVFIPVNREELIPFLIEGKGDIAAAALTVTPEREKKVAFTDPYLTDIQEILVTAKGVEGINSIGDLAGRTVHVTRASSYAEHLKTHNTMLRRMQLPEVKIVEMDEHLQTEDILELVNAGIIKLTVVDRHLAELWEGLLDDMVLRNDIVVNEGGSISLAVRKSNPELLADLNGFVAKNRNGTHVGNVLFKRYYRQETWIKNPLSEIDQGWRQYLIPLFSKHAEAFGFDAVAVAALSYQESGWDPDLVSPVGAVGVMQVLPTTAADMGVTDVYDADQNILAGVKYLDWMRKHYFDDPDLDEVNRVDFLYASYNAGPNKIVRLREKAEEMGLDPNVWFRNVELVARRYIGRETVQYVARVNKYYFAFKMGQIQRWRRDEEREALKGQ